MFAIELRRLPFDAEHNALFEIHRKCFGGFLHLRKLETGFYYPEATKQEIKILTSTGNIISDHLVTKCLHQMENAAFNVGSAAPRIWDAGSCLHPACGFPSFWQTTMHNFPSMDQVPLSRYSE